MSLDTLRVEVLKTHGSFKCSPNCIQIGLQCRSLKINFQIPYHVFKNYIHCVKFKCVVSYLIIRAVPLAYAGIVYPYI